MSRLVIESGVDVGMIFPLSAAPVTMGRSVSNSIQIIDRKVSRHHAEISFKDGTYFFRDMGSKNGSYVNNKRVKKIITLVDGCMIKVGETTLVYESGPEDKDQQAELSSKIVHIVDNVEWGTHKSFIAAGSHPNLDIAVKPVEDKALKGSHKRLSILYQVGDTIRNLLNLEDLLDQIMEIIYEVIKPDRGFIMLIDEQTGDLIPQVIKKRNEDEEDITISSTIVEKCICDQISILVSDAASDQRFSASESIILNKIRSAICSPLIYKEEVIGVIYVDSQNRVVSYTEEELELVNGIANQAAMAIANALLHARMVEQHKMEKEMEIARTIQMNLLPKVFPSLENIDISAMSLPAKKVGGDYYDFIPLSDGRYGIVIADVSGKGVPAAILLATIRASLLIEAQQENADVLSVISRLNHMACRDATNNMYITMVYGILDPEKMTFEYTNAGHAYPLLFETSKRLKQLKTGGNFLGILENVDYKSQNIEIRSGQTFILYSDGVTDTMNTSGELFGLDRLKKHIKSKLNHTAQEIRDFVYDACIEFREGAEQFDDFTLVIMKIL
jgi:phosphoserine phosphatase RsbU/P